MPTPHASRRVSRRASRRLSRTCTAIVLGALAATLPPAAAAEETAEQAVAPAVAPDAVRGAAVPAAEEPPEPPPPPLDVLERRPGTGEGLLFVGPQKNPGRVGPPGEEPPPEAGRGPQILDDRGRPVWYHRIPQNEYVADFRVQEYRGRKVLTWWQGRSDSAGLGEGVGYIADENYDIIATVRSPDPEQSIDLHEFRLTPQGTALVVSYQERPYDLTPVGGPADGDVLESVVWELDLATGEPLLEWRSLDHVPLQESDERPTGRAGTRPFDYLHTNSVSLDTDGDLLVSAVGTSTVYKLDRETGEIVWRLGGKNSDFRLGAGARTIAQHDVVAVGDGTYRMFDNQNLHSDGYESRVAWLRIDPRRGTAELERQLVHPDRVSTAVTGGSQGLPSGNTLVGWGSAGRISEFDAAGRLVFDAVFPEEYGSYRTYRDGWEGEPGTAPEVRIDGASGDAHAVWNGATEVAAWRVLAGDARDGLRPVAREPWDGLDTDVDLPADAADAAYVQAEALDADGEVIGASAVTETRAG
ncbi:arylsulfotransferase family protein [Streptomyces sp. B22F1]|uniref:arylsulfotransferase family protein n=1 Tax=Streptomyces sp. B22F1 TaxID=3153566 RepID=UPI001199821A